VRVPLVRLQRGHQRRLPARLRLPLRQACSGPRRPLRPLEVDCSAQLPHQLQRLQARHSSVQRARRPSRQLPRVQQHRHRPLQQQRDCLAPPHPHQLLPPPHLRGLNLLQAPLLHSHLHQEHHCLALWVHPPHQRPRLLLQQLPQRVQPPRGPPPHCRAQNKFGCLRCRTRRLTICCASGRREWRIRLRSSRFWLTRSSRRT